ncbi:MAG: Intracellular protease, partial [uncultured Gemmatimonadetes bacterium]
EKRQLGRTARSGARGRWFRAGGAYLAGGGAGGPRRPGGRRLAARGAHPRREPHVPGEEGAGGLHAGRGGGRRLRRPPPPRRADQPRHAAPERPRAGLRLRLQRAGEAHRHDLPCPLGADLGRDGVGPAAHLVAGDQARRAERGRRVERRVGGARPQLGIQPRPARPAGVQRGRRRPLRRARPGGGGSGGGARGRPGDAGRRHRRRRRGLRRLAVPPGPRRRLRGGGPRAPGRHHPHAPAPGARGSGARRHRGRRGTAL